MRPKFHYIKATSNVKQLWQINNKPILAVQVMHDNSTDVKVLIKHHLIKTNIVHKINKNKKAAT